MQKLREAVDCLDCTGAQLTFVWFGYQASQACERQVGMSGLGSGGRKMTAVKRGRDLGLLIQPH